MFSFKCACYSCFCCTCIHGLLAGVSKTRNLAQACRRLEPIRARRQPTLSSPRRQRFRISPRPTQPPRPASPQTRQRRQTQPPPVGQTMRPVISPQRHRYRLPPRLPRLRRRRRPCRLLPLQGCRPLRQPPLPRQLQPCRQPPLQPRRRYRPRPCRHRRAPLHLHQRPRQQLSRLRSPRRHPPLRRPQTRQPPPLLQSGQQHRRLHRQRRQQIHRPRPRPPQPRQLSAYPLLLQ